MTMTQGKSQNDTLKEQIIDNNHLFDDARLVIRDHGVVRAVEGLDVADLAGDDGEAHPVLGGDVPGHVGDGIYPPLHPVVCYPHLTHLTQTARSSLCTR